MAHVVNIVRGVGPFVVCFALFALAGLGLFGFAGGRRDTASNGPAHTDIGSAALLVAALFALWCWYGIGSSARLQDLVTGFLIAVGIVIAVRARAIVGAIRRGAVFGRSTFGWLSAFIVFYALSYLFFTPTVSGEHLPITSYRNNDVWNYLNVTLYLLNPGPPNVAGMTFPADFYPQTPAVYAFAGLAAAFFGQDPMTAAMPMQFGCSALIALLAARLVRRVFAVSPLWAVAIGSILLAGPFFRYVAGNYFLSTLMSVPVLLHLQWTTIVRESTRRRVDLPLALEVGAHYLLLVMLYPPVFLCALAIQGLIIATLVLSSVQSDVQRVRYSIEVLVNLGKQATVVVAGIGLAVLTVPSFAMPALRRLLYVGQPAVAGWTLDFISPLALLGVPGNLYLTQVTTLEGRVYAIAGSWLLAMILLALFLWRFRAHTNAAERGLVVATAAGFIASCLVFFRYGPGYQQWKFASYWPLPLSAVVVAAAVRLRPLLMASAAPLPAGVGRSLGFILPTCLALVVVGGNLRIHNTVEPPMGRVRSGLRDLKQVERMTLFHDMYVEMSGTAETFVAVYFIRSKLMHLITPSYYPQERLDLDRVSETMPYLIQDFDCAGVGHNGTIAIKEVGCLLFAPPSPELGVSYPFNRTFMFVDNQRGIGRRESMGRWTDDRTARFVFRADKNRVPLDRILYLNLQVVPYVRPGMAAQRIILSWGASHMSDVTVAGAEWISIPLEPADWTGIRARTVDVSFGFPNAVAPAAVEPGSDDIRPRAVQFVDLVLSLSPRGKIVSPATPAR